MKKAGKALLAAGASTIGGGCFPSLSSVLSRPTQATPTPFLLSASSTPWSTAMASFYSSSASSPIPTLWSSEMRRDGGAFQLSSLPVLSSTGDLDIGVEDGGRRGHLSSILATWLLDMGLGENRSDDGEGCCGGL